MLKQGIKKEFVFIICLICALSDAALIFARVFGLGYLVQKFTYLQDIARYGGFLFLLIYGLKSFYTAFTMSQSLVPQDFHAANLSKTVLLTLAFTWLNPHVYLDTVILLGMVAAKFGERAYIFGLGAASASFTFFFSLGYGARLLAPLFARKGAWKILEIFVEFTMVALAFMLLLK